MNASVYGAAFEYIASRYFTQPSYYRVPTVLANGTTAQCAYFSFYQPEYLVWGVGGEAAAAQLIQDVRALRDAICPQFS